MDAINRIIIDVSDPLNTQVVHAVQEDIRSRFVEITLVRNGEPLSIPVGAIGVIGLRRPNDTYVLYDTDEDGNAAVTFDGSVATCYLRQEALAMAGSMYTSVSIYSSDRETRLTAFHFMTNVEPTAVPSDVIVEHDYINIFQTELDEINTLLGDLSATATTLPSGSDATASYSDGVFSFGIPKGDSGGVTEDQLYAVYPHDVSNGSPAYITDGADDIPVRGLTVHIVPSQSGSGVPSPDNVRTISGWTGANIYRDSVHSPSATPSATVDWSGSAGTVYGGTLDLTAGKLIVDRALLTLDSNIPSGTSGIRNITAIGNSVRFEYYPYRSIGVALAPLVSDKFANAATNAGNPWVADTGSGSSPRMYVCMGSTYTTDALIRQWFASNPTTFVYKIPNATEYTLTPETISTLLGENYVWADCGDVVLDYRADTTLYIQKLTMPDDDMIANANIAAHKFFMVGNSLFYSTSAITAGQSIIVGTNCNRVSLADALNQINA